MTRPKILKIGTVKSTKDDIRIRETFLEFRGWEIEGMSACDAFGWYFTSLKDVMCSKHYGYTAQELIQIYAQKYLTTPEWNLERHRQVAQLVEFPFDLGKVGGSSPFLPTK